MATTTSSEDFLAGRAAASAARAAALLQIAPAADWTTRALAAPPAPRLRRDDFTLIAEIKLAAPSRQGALGSAEDLTHRVRAYACGGAQAISVLTEPDHFAGSLEHLRSAAAYAGDTPVMRKDFLVDPVQIDEARLHGAGGVLLIAELLDDRLLLAMLAAARRHGMFVLLESFGGDSLARACEHADTDVLIGVNCRDLRSLRVDPGRFVELAPRAAQVGAIAESGLHGAEDVTAITQLGYRGALVGTALMRDDDPASAVTRMVQAGRRAACA